MEPQVLGVQRSYHSATHQQPWSRIPPDGTRGFCAASSSSSSVQFASLRKQQLHPQWHFRVEKKVTLRPARRSNALEVRASKKSGTGFKLPGTLKLKRGEESSGEDKEVAAAENGTQKLRKPSGTVKLPGTLRLPGRAKGRRKDNNVVFVAGSTGKVGRRVVRELLQLGYSVRAGVRNSGSDKAKTLLEFAAGTDKPEEKNEEEEEAKEEERPSLWSNFAPEKIFGFLRSRSAKKEPGVDLVEVDLEKPDELDGALGEAGVVVCAIGASEKEAFNVTAPYRIDYKATENLINAAIDAKVNHFVLVTSLGTQKIGWPASVLNLFWGVLVWKAKAEKALIESGIPFTIIRPGGMEKPTDTYKDTHNLLLAKADSRFGGQVSSLQVAELIAGVVSNLELAQDKVLEAVAETTAPLRYIEDLLAEIPSASEIEEEKEAGISKLAALKAAETEEKLAKQEELKAAKQREEEEKLAKREELIAAKQREEEERLAAEARAAAEKEKTEALRQKLQNEYLEAKQREEEASKDAEAARLEKEEIERRVADIRSRAEAAAQAAREAKALEVATRGAARQGTKLTDQEKKDIVASVRAEIEAEAKQKEAKEKAIQDSKVKTKPVPDVKSKVAEKGKKDAEAKAVAEEERVAKAEAAKKAKAEAEEKEKAEAEIRAKAKAEEKAKAEAESKAKAEAEAVERAKAEAEIKEKAEAEKQLKVEAERKAKQEEEEKLKAEAEAKAEEAKEKAIEKSPVSELPAPPIPSPPKVADEVADPAAEAVKVALGKLDKVLAEEAPEALEEQQDEAVDEKEEERQRTLAVQAREESKAREQLALEKAKSSSVNFLFPWQKAQPAAERPEKETSSSKPDLVAPLNEAVDNTIGSLSVPETEELQDSRKPPSSPSPSAPGPPVLSETQAVAEKDDAPLSDTEAVAEKDDAPLSETETVAEKEDAPPAEKEPSPTNGFVDLKPLSSATPSPLSNIDKTGLYYAVEEATDIAELATQQAAEAAARAEEALEKAKAATAGTFAWPWQNTDPAAPNNGPTPLDSATPVQQLSSTDLPRTPRPLSPYARYPGLKPPTSPTPSAPKSIVKEEASDPPSGQELASAAEDEKVQEVVTQVLETASTGSFRWPWQ